VTAGVHAIASRAPVDASSGASHRLLRGLEGVDAKARTMLRSEAYLREGGDSGQRRVRQSDLHRVEPTWTRTAAGTSYACKLRAALDDLPGNARKSTRETPDARIEVGRELRDGQAVHFVRDNGVGFNQQYVDKLPSPLERLHTESENEGTGIGPAGVARIVALHRGRVWAASVDHGATFSFTPGSEVPSAAAW